jgi:hypothetical protein
MNGSSATGCGQEIDIIEQYPGFRAPSPVSYGAGSLHAKRRVAPGVGKQGCAHETFKGPGTEGDSIWRGVGDFTSGWTVFTLDWTEDWMSMSVNGTVVANFDNATIIRSFTDLQPLILTATAMERVPTLPEDVFPQEYLVDWVRVYAWD